MLLVGAFRHLWFQCSGFIVSEQIHGGNPAVNMRTYLVSGILAPPLLSFWPGFQLRLFAVEERVQTVQTTQRDHWIAHSCKVKLLAADVCV